MTDCGGYVPNIADFQQIPLGGPTGRVDCTAWEAAILVAAYTCGKTLITGRAVRLATDEPVPDPLSPGLNLAQVDAAVLILTGQRVDLDTRLSYPSSEAQRRIVAGQWAGVQVNRGVLVSAGIVTGFRGGHALTVHAEHGLPVLGDPLVPAYVKATWAQLWAAAAALIGSYGRANVQFTRDITATYAVSVPAGYYYAYTVVDGRIRGYRRKRTSGIGQPYTPGVVSCSAPRMVWWGDSTKRYQLVRLLNGAHQGEWIRASYAHEVPE